MMNVLFWRKKKSAEPAEPFCLNAEGTRLYSLGYHEFVFYYKGDQLFELIPRELIYLFQYQILRLGNILTDEEGRKWLVRRVEISPHKGKHLKIGGDCVAFSESGFSVVTYTIEEFGSK